MTPIPSAAQSGSISRSSFDAHQRLFGKSEEADRMVLDRVAEVAAARGIPRTQVALAWLLSKPVITAPIARNKPPAPSDRTHAVILPAHREFADSPLEGTGFEPELSPNFGDGVTDQAAA
jgi:hypothetical protein